MIPAISTMGTRNSSADTGHAYNLISLENHIFQLHLGEFKRILENENIKDRYVVVVSIAGAFRKGKSFLMNFFLKYLYAQVTTDTNTTRTSTNTYQ